MTKMTRTTTTKTTWPPPTPQPVLDVRRTSSPRPKPPPQRQRQRRRRQAVPSTSMLPLQLFHWPRPNQQILLIILLLRLHPRKILHGRSSVGKSCPLPSWSCLFWRQVVDAVRQPEVGGNIGHRPNLPLLLLLLLRRLHPSLPRSSNLVVVTASP